MIFRPSRWMAAFVIGGLGILTTGSALPVYANSDFNYDGRDDLAIGVPHEDLGDTENAGAVNVLYGTSSRLSSAGDQFWHQDNPNVEGSIAGPDQFGRSLASGDFDGDGHADLAIGVPTEVVGSNTDAGAVNVLYGSPSKLTAADDQLWTQDSSGVEDAAESSDHFGWAFSGNS